MNHHLEMNWGHCRLDQLTALRGGQRYIGDKHGTSSLTTMAVFYYCCYVWLPQEESSVLIHSPVVKVGNDVAALSFGCSTSPVSVHDPGHNTQVPLSMHLWPILQALPGDSSEYQYYMQHLLYIT